jgi:hypothetical protein
MLNPDAKEYNLISREIKFLPDISVFYDKKDLLIPFNFKSVAKNFKKPSGSRKRVKVNQFKK